MNYVQFHIGDFRAGVMNLTRLERWIYRDMLDVCYDKECPLPADLDAVCRLLGVRSDEERAAVVSVLEQKFTLTERGYENSRVEREVAKYHARVDSAKASGAKGGAAKAKQPPSEPLAVAKQPPSEPLPNQEPITNNQQPIKTLDRSDDRSARASDADPLFIEFWMAYPRKVAKPAALKAWRTLRVDGTMQAAILKGLNRDRLSVQWSKDDGQFIPHPATWLNQRRWEDEATTEAAEPEVL